MPDLAFTPNISSLLESFTLDGIAIVALVAVLFFYTVRYGKEQAISLVLALYIALLAFIYFPYKERFLFFTENETQLLLSSALLFGVFTILGYLAVAPLLRNRYAAYGNGKWVEALLLSVATVALLVAFSYHVLPITSLYTFGEPITNLFAPSQFFFWWLTAPAVVLMLIGRR